MPLNFLEVMIETTNSFLMESVLTDLFSTVLKELMDHLLAYLGVATAASAGAGYVLNLRYKKSVVRSTSEQKNEGPVAAGDDIVNGNQTLINNNYYAASESKEEIINYQKTPVPNEMVQEIQNLPLSSQPLAQKKYEGRNFQWDVKFLKLTKKGEADKFRVFFTDPDAFGKPMIYCDLNLKDHPHLNNISEGQEVKVSGQLTCFNGNEMNLELDKVIYAQKN